MHRLMAATPKQKGMRKKSSRKTGRNAARGGQDSDTDVLYLSLPEQSAMVGLVGMRGIQGMRAMRALCDACMSKVYRLSVGLVNHKFALKVTLLD